MNRRLAVAGLGVTMAFEAHVRDYLARGELVRVLDKFCQPFPGYHLDYPQRRHASRALRAFVDHLRGTRREGNAKGRRLGSAARKDRSG